MKPAPAPQSENVQLAAVTVFTILYLALGMMLAASKKNWEFVFYIRSWCYLV